MKKLYRLQLLLMMVLIAAIIHSCKKDDNNPPDDEPEVPVVTERERILNEYTTNYLGSAVTTLGWTGNNTGCVAGTVAADAHSKTLQRIKYFRRMAKLPDDITFDATKNAQCQEAALMMSANSALSHTPPTSWLCYTADGATAAGSSNLALGSHSSGAITLFMQDPGSSNTACGHRRWLLYSKSKVMGHGSTSNSSAVWVTGNSGNTPLFTPEYIAWPPSGYVPGPLVYARWSFSIPGAGFAGAAVSMKDPNNNPMSLTVVSTASGYGDNTIVWEPVGVNTTSATDLTYHVTVSNVTVGGQPKTYNYDVTIIKP